MIFHITGIGLVYHIPKYWFWVLLRSLQIFCVFFQRYFFKVRKIVPIILFRYFAIGRTSQGTGKRLLTRHLEMLGVLPTNVRNLQIPMESIFGVFSKNNLNKKVKPDRASQNWQKINLTLPSHLIRL